MRITPKMADIPVMGYQAFWTDTCNKLKSKYQHLIGQFPDDDAQLKQPFKAICDIEEMAVHSSLSGRKKTGRTSVKSSMGRTFLVPCMAHIQSHYMS
jgi:hypothetical protein